MRGIAVEVGVDETFGSRAGSLLGLSDGQRLIDGTPVTVGPLDTDIHCLDFLMTTNSEH